MRSDARIQDILHTLSNPEDFVCGILGNFINEGRERFRHDTAYKRHERGEIDSEEFFANLRAFLEIDISDAQLLDGWNSILVGEMPGVSELLAKAAGSFPLYAFTNSNREHNSTGQSSFPAFSAISKRSTCRRRLG